MRRGGRALLAAGMRAPPGRWGCVVLVARDLWWLRVHCKDGGVSARMVEIRRRGRGPPRKAIVLACRVYDQIGDPGEVGRALPVECTEREQVRALVGEPEPLIVSRGIPEA